MYGGSETGYAGPVFEVEFVLQGPSHSIGDLIAEDGTFDLAAMIPRPDGRYAQFFDVSGVDPSRIEAGAATPEGIDVTLLREYENGGLVEFLVPGEWPTARLAELGAIPRRVEGLDDGGRIVANVPPRYDPSAIVETFTAEFPEATLASKRERESSTVPFTRPAFQEALQKRLTDRQREVLRVAFEAGYYEWPRRTTGEEVAEELDIASATFSEHVHAAERKLLTAAFAGLDTDHGSGQ